MAVILELSDKQAILLRNVLDDTFETESRRALRTGSPGAARNAVMADELRDVIRDKLDAPEIVPALTIEDAKAVYDAIPFKKLAKEAAGRTAAGH